MLPGPLVLLSGYYQKVGLLWLLRFLFLFGFREPCFDFDSPGFEFFGFGEL